jgi:hypothetical protein
MVEQVKSGNTQIFNTFTLAEKNMAQYYLPKDSNAVQQIEPAKDTVTISENQEEQVKKKSHRKRNLAYAVGSSALVVGGGVLVLMRGLPKNTEKYLDKLRKYFEKKSENSKGSEKMQRFWEYSIRKIDSFKDATQSINNFTSLKDIQFKHLMDKTEPTAKIHKSITNYFEKLARKTVSKGYKKAGKKFDKMFAEFDKLDETILKNGAEDIVTYKGKQYTKKELLEIAKKYRADIKDSVTEFMSQEAMDNRYQYIKDSTDELYTYFWDNSFKGFFTKEYWTKNNPFLRKEMWTSYIPDAKIQGNKKTLTDEVIAVRNKIAYTEKDKMGVISQYIKNLRKIIPPNDTEGLSIIKKLEWFTENPEGLAANSENFLKELSKLNDRPFEKGLEESIIETQAKMRDSYIKSINNLVKDSDEGQLQDLMEIYKVLDAYALSHSNAEKYVENAVGSFDKALKTETVDFFDKVRDLVLGSAPTDVLSLLASGGMIAYGLGDAHDKDERISVMLTAGIPILGSIGTTIICTTKLISGGISLALGAITGIGFAKVGNALDNKRTLALAQKNPTNGQVA